MSVRAIDGNGDWMFGRGFQDYRSNENELLQKIRTRLLSWKGDCFFDEGEGVDWNNYLDIGTLVLLDVDIQRVVLQTAGVIRFREYASELDPGLRALTVTMTLDTVYGEIIFTEVF